MKEQEDLMRFSYWNRKYTCNTVIANFLKDASSWFGITHNELYHRVYKAYRRHPSIYELNHNVPGLLIAKGIIEVHNCVRMTDNNINLLIDKYDVYIKNLQPPLYPAFPVALYKLREIIKRIWPYLPENGQVKKEYATSDQFMDNWSFHVRISFYGSWDILLKDKHKALDWVNGTIDQLRALGEDGDGSIAINNIINRFLEDLNNESAGE